VRHDPAPSPCGIFSGNYDGVLYGQSPHEARVYCEFGMALVSCRSCGNTVAAASTVCPVCGKSFRIAAIRRLLMWAVLALLVFLVLFKHRLFH
jgi:hypothetical protein